MAKNTMEPIIAKPRSRAKQRITIECSLAPCQRDRSATESPDALVAYGGSVGIVLYKTLGQVSVSKLQFFHYFSYTTCVVCVLCLAVSGRSFLRRARA